MMMMMVTALALVFGGWLRADDVLHIHVHTSLLRFTTRGGTAGWEVVLLRGKTDQAGAGTPVFIPERADATCAVQLYEPNIKLFAVKITRPTMHQLLLLQSNWTHDYMESLQASRLAMFRPASQQLPCSTVCVLTVSGKRTCNLHAIIAGPVNWEIVTTTC
jgi:hypothetical protein